MLRHPQTTPLLAILILASCLAYLSGCRYDEEKPIFMAPGSYGDIAIVVSDASMVGAVEDLKTAMNEEFTFVLAREKRFNFDVYPPDQVKLCEGYKNIIFLWRVGDEVLIDGMLVNGSARAVGWLSSVVRHLQTGYLYHYAFAMIVGVVVGTYSSIFVASPIVLILNRMAEQRANRR